MRMQHNINEDYGHYAKRKYLEERRKLVRIIIFVAIFAILGFGGMFLDKVGIMNSGSSAGDAVFAVFGWALIIVAIYFGYKIYKKLSIPKKRWTRRELEEVDEM
jgi:amino acid permease